MNITTGTHLLAFLCILITVGTTGCKKAQETAIPPATPAAAPIWPATRKTDRGNFTVTIQPAGSGITLNKHFSLNAILTPETGASAPTSVSVNADMPSHGHGMNTAPETIHEEGQRYRADGMLFHMAGDWSIMVEITAGGKIERAFFPINVE
jgi:hypothetical protein